MKNIIDIYEGAFEPGVGTLVNLKVFGNKHLKDLFALPEINYNAKIEEVTVNGRNVEVGMKTLDGREGHFAEIPLSVWGGLKSGKIHWKENGKEKEIALL